MYSQVGRKLAELGARMGKPTADRHLSHITKTPGGKTCPGFFCFYFFIIFLLTKSLERHILISTNGGNAPKKEKEDEQEDVYSEMRRLYP